MCPDLYSRQESLYRLHLVHYLYEFEYWLTFAMQFQLIQFDFFYLSEQTLDTNHQLMDFAFTRSSFRILYLYAIKGIWHQIAGYGYTSSNRVISFSCVGNINGDFKPQWINEINRISSHIDISINPTRQANRVTLIYRPICGVVIPEPCCNAARFPGRNTAPETAD